MIQRTLKIQSFEELEEEIERGVDLKQYDYIHIITESYSFKVLSVHPSATQDSIKKLFRNVEVCINKLIKGEVDGKE